MPRRPKALRGQDLDRTPQARKRRKWSPEEDAALIGFVRANPVTRQGYWRDAAAAVGFAPGKNKLVLMHYWWLCKKDPELPKPRSMLREILEKCPGALSIRKPPEFAGDKRAMAILRAARERCRKRGEIVLPSYIWTATEDKALIDFVRANPVFLGGYKDYWGRAALAVGGRKWSSARWRWAELRRMRVPLPAIVYPRREYKSRIWNDECIARVRRALTTGSRKAVAERLGLSYGKMCKALARHGYGRARPYRPDACRLSDADRADAALMERALRDFEKESANAH